MTASRAQRYVVRVLAALLVSGVCLFTYAASQSGGRIEPHASLGVTLQTVTWDAPNPGFAWEAVSDVQVDYTWDWTPASVWPKAGNPPVSSHGKTRYAAVEDGYGEVAYIDTYAVTNVDQTNYTASVELRLVIENSADGSSYVCYTSSTTSSDAYNNLIDHTISESDWIIYPN